MARLLAAILLAWLITAGSVAAQADRPLADPTAEHRALALHKELRCLVCQNQAINDSNAELARQLRQIVRERIAAGDSDEKVRRYVVDRYGDWVLMRPPFKWSTALLWLSPALLFALVVAIAIVQVRRKRGTRAEPPLSTEEQRKLDALLSSDDRVRP
ncbi:MAG: cytochrome c-type biogenesis protein CcmH [Alphaproteobacteria bacterium]|nr:cytochrome c-type biogenesis protein CcmH [Alphaproteobacteria bacterium]